MPTCPITKGTALFCSIAEPLYADPKVKEGTMMGFKCLPQRRRLLRHLRTTAAGPNSSSQNSWDKPILATVNYLSWAGQPVPYCPKTPN